MSDSEIAQFLAGRVSAGDLVRVRRHLEQCVDCRLRVSGNSPVPDQMQDMTEDHTPTAADGSAADPFVNTLPAVEGYQVLSRIHSGAQGVVFKAVQRSTGRTVALKLLPHEHSATQRQKHRFEREVSLAASLRHPNVVTIFDSGLTEGRYYFAMEYIRGAALDQHLASASLSVPQKLRIFATICAAVSYAHQKGIIHRDLKPGNILVDAAGEPHIVDFGLAKAAGPAMGHGAVPYTLTSHFMGTPAYASPEQTRGDPSLVDARSDVYALGVILFEMLTGRYPYPVSHDLVQMFHSICNVQPLKPSSIAPELDSDVDTIVLRALAKEPLRRYQTVAELQEDVERWLAGEPINARRDSLMYVMKVRGRRWTTRHPAVLSIVAVMVASVGMLNLAGPLFRMWSWPFDAYENFLASTFAPAENGVPYKDIRVIAIDDESVGHIESAAEIEGLEDVSSSDWRSLRRMHGRLMEKLARIKPGAVVWDIAFPEPSEAEEAKRVSAFNSDFVKGVEALKGVGVTPIVVVRSWEADSAAPSSIAPEILRANVRRAGDIFRFPDSAPWRTALVVKRGKGSGKRLLGLSLAAACAMREPNKDVVVEMNEAWQTLHVGYAPREMLRDPASFAEPQPFACSYIAPFRATSLDEPGVGLEDGDVIAWLVVRLPTDDEIQRMTMSYHQALAADERQLAQWFSGKLVVIGDLRAASQDWRIAPNGELRSGLHAHLAAMDSILRDSIAMRFPSTFSYFAILFCAASLGVVLFWALPRRAVHWVAASIVACGAICLASIGAFHWSSYLCDPFVPSAAMLVALLIVAALIPNERVQFSSISSAGQSLP